jgi:hypothetical protein
VFCTQFLIFSICYHHIILSKKRLACKIKKIYHINLPAVPPHKFTYLILAEDKDAKTLAAVLKDGEKKEETAKDDSSEDAEGASGGSSSKEPDIVDSISHFLKDKFEKLGLGDKSEKEAKVSI